MGKISKRNWNILAPIISAVGNLHCSCLSENCNFQVLGTRSTFMKPMSITVTEDDMRIFTCCVVEEYRLIATTSRANCSQSLHGGADSLSKTSYHTAQQRYLCDGQPRRKTAGNWSGTEEKRQRTGGRGKWMLERGGRVNDCACVVVAGLRSAIQSLIKRLVLLRREISKQTSCAEESCSQLAT